MKYSEQFNKLTTAYVAGKVDPYSACGCFVGNLLNNNREWIEARFGLGNIGDYDKKTMEKSTNCVRKESNGLYSLQEIYNLEKLFLETYSENKGDTQAFSSSETPTQQDEDALFIAFEKTLDALKELHISKGEVIDEVPVFKKRTFQTA